MVKTSENQPVKKKRGTRGLGSIRPKNGGYEGRITIKLDGISQQISLYNKDKRILVQEMISKKQEANDNEYVGKHKITLEEWLKKWIRIHKRPFVKPRTLQGYIEKINKNIIPYLGKYPMQSLNRLILQEYFSDLTTGNEKKNIKKEVGKTSTVKRKTNTKKNTSQIKQEKSEIKKDDSFSNKIKKIVSSYAFLYSVFSILIVCVAVLAGMVFVKGKEYKKNKSDIVVPILEDGTRSALNIDLKQLKKTGEYRVKITNYRGDKINNSSMDYSITVRNVTSTDVKVTKDDSKDNLIVDKEATIIEGVGFGSTSKEEDVYHFTINDDSEIENGALISLEIVASKRSS